MSRTVGLPGPGVDDAWLGVLSFVAEVLFVGQGPAGALPEREAEVLRLVAAGSSNREMERELHITEGTVKNHVSNAPRKLGLRDRTQAAFYAVERGWIGRPRRPLRPRKVRAP